MKKVIISLLSVLAIAFAFVGCNDANINSSTNVADSVVEDTTVTEEEIAAEQDAAVNELGINSALGTPPARPGA